MPRHALCHEGAALVKKAVSQDQEGETNKKVVLLNYLKGIEKLLRGVHVVKDKKLHRTILLRVLSYLDRAETLKKSICSEPPKAEGRRPDDEQASAIASKLEGTIVKDVKTRWDDVTGLDFAKQTLKEAVILPITHPSLFKGNQQSWRGILLYGPPGTGKSFIASAVAGESAATFFSVSASDLISKWQGESEKGVKALFQLARERAPSVVFIDEIDSIASHRSDNEHEATRRVKNQFLGEMDGVNKVGGKRVLVLAATNNPWSIDDAFLRRFEKRIYVSLPDKSARKEMFKRELATISEEEAEAFSERTENYSGADISTVLKDAEMSTLRQCMEATAFEERDGQVTPTDKPPCSSCPGDAFCDACKRYPFTIDKLPADVEVVRRDCTAKDVSEAIGRNHSTANRRSLDRLETWSKQFSPNP